MLFATVALGCLLGSTAFATEGDTPGGGNAPAPPTTSRDPAGSPPLRPGVPAETPRPMGNRPVPLPPGVREDWVEKMVPPAVDPADPVPSSGTEAGFSAADVALRAVLATYGVGLLNNLVRFYREEEQKVPAGVSFWVEVKAEYFPPAERLARLACPANEEGLADPQSTYYKGLTWRNLGQVGNPPPAQDERAACRQTVHVRLVGVGPVTARSEVHFSISPRHQRQATCRPAYFEARLRIIVDGKPYQIPPRALGARWQVSDPDGLREVRDPGTFIPAGAEPVFLQGYRALKPGDYEVTATIALDTSTLPYLTEEARKELGQVTAKATVTYEEPRISAITVKPETVTVPAGRDVEFKAIAHFSDGCPDADVTHHPDTQWAPGGSPFVHAPDPVPFVLSISSASHPEFKAQACETAFFQAFVRLRSPEQSQTVTATHTGVTGSARVTFGAGEREEPADPEVRWTPGSSVTVRDGTPVDVVALHVPSGLSAARTLHVIKPTLSLRVRANRAEVEVGETAAFEAAAEYPEGCLSEDATAKVTWPGGNPVRADEPGVTIEREVSYTDGFGNTASGKAAVKVRWPPLSISPSQATLTLGQVQTFSASLTRGSWSKPASDDVEWVPARSYTADRCGIEQVTATHGESGQASSATLTVQADPVECAAIRDGLAGLRPDQAAEGRQWIAKRDALRGKGCACDVPDLPWTAGNATTEGVPEEPQPPIQVSVGLPPPVPGGPAAGCNDPRREPVVGPDGRTTCGPCRAGFFPDGPDRCATPGEIVDSSACPNPSAAKTYDSQTGKVMCCPPEAPVWDPARGQCLLRPDQAGLPRAPGPAPGEMPPFIDIGGIFVPPIFGPMPPTQPAGPGFVPPPPAPRAASPPPRPAPSRCHRNPRTGQIHCGTN